jgi:hypothetical protein
VGKYFDLSQSSEEETAKNGIVDELSYTLYIADSKRNECPKLRVSLRGEEIYVLIDTGCEMSILNEHLYNKLRHAGLKCLELPTQNINLARSTVEAGE